MVRLLTWNVNGLRAVLQRNGHSLKSFLDGLEADIICLQETKMTRSELDEQFVRPAGYDAYYSFSRGKGGYSGVVTFCKQHVAVYAAEEGLTGYWKTEDSIDRIGSIHNDFSSAFVQDLETEGRCILTDHGTFVLFNVYCPALRNMERLEYKLSFHKVLQDRVQTLQADGKPVIVVGDINISHRRIDHCDPQDDEDGPFEKHPFRLWMDTFAISELTLEDKKRQSPGPPGLLVDAFRYFHPKEAKAYTCWNTKTSARETNYGTRIDYILIDLTLHLRVSDCVHHPNQLGSDHCPVILTGEILPPCGPDKPPALCSRYFTEFAGKQQSITAFFSQQKQQDADEARPVSPIKATKKRKVGGQRSIASFFSSPAAHTLKQQSHHKAFFLPASASGESEADSQAIIKEVHEEQRLATENKRMEWSQVLNGRPPTTPLCNCGLPTVLRSVVKATENWGRKFYVCKKPAGERGDPNARCDFFQWSNNRSGQNKRLGGSGLSKINL